MPLPAALLAKLAKRGIVENEKADAINSSNNANISNNNKGPPPHSVSKPEEVEEVFAEDYDDPSKPEIMEASLPEEQAEPVVAEMTPSENPLFFETTACPFRSNPYHECLAYCRKTYGMREWDPDESDLKKRNRMLRRYPLPNGWVEVGDFDTGRYYYWNIATDEVSWLSPTHPKARISRSAEYLGVIGKIGNLDSEGEEAMDTSINVQESDSGSDTSLSDEEDFIDKRGRVRDNRKRLPEFTKKGKKRDEIDPMDPAAYSDIARGGWSDGLDTRGKAKTGVDVTASGPLFQQRPYPSPGDILRANQGMKKKK